MIRLAVLINIKVIRFTIIVEIDQNVKKALVAKSLRLNLKF